MLISTARQKNESLILDSQSVPIVLSSVVCAAVLQALALKEIRHLVPQGKNSLNQNKGTGT